MSSATLFPQHVIARKRDGHLLTRDEIAAFVRGATDGSWADYQLSALLMAIFLRGMTPEETALLTDAMMRSGVVADLSSVPGIKVDKHSTGGVGDKVSIPLAPMVVACGVPVPMISGRGLGHSGGTLDKLESIPGFQTGLSLDAYRAQVRRIGCALIGQTKDLAPADKTLYALRDVTATVECIPLICASILSKKLAEGIDALVLDVKFGRGAFMKTLPEARRLAEALVAVGRAGGKQVRALLTAMDEPLGRSVGNAVEVAESIACLRGAGPGDLMEVTYSLGAHMLILGGAARTLEEARSRLERSVRDGSALARFREIVVAQGGDARVVDEPQRLPAARLQEPLAAERDGVVTDVDAMAVALAALRLGAGRARATDRIDPAVGITCLVKRGERVTRGATLCVLHANDETALAEARLKLLGAIAIGDSSPTPTPLVAETIL
ncbi:MAG: thymidine phosphorylase [Opitutaceae bacterium]|nr:thymidine phosphorylase [Opitutaceae bacterium]